MSRCCYLFSKFHEEILSNCNLKLDLRTLEIGVLWSFVVNTFKYVRQKVSVLKKSTLQSFFNQNLRQFLVSKHLRIMPWRLDWRYRLCIKNYFMFSSLCQCNINVLYWSQCAKTKKSVKSPTFLAKFRESNLCSTILFEDEPF